MIILCTTTDDAEILIYSNNICYIVKSNKDDSAIIYMSNGEVLRIKTPAYELWKNDYYVQK